MSKSRLPEEILSQFVNELSKRLEENPGTDINVNSGFERMDIIPNTFSLLFHSNLKYLIQEYNLKTTEIVALLQINEYMQYGNLIQMSYSKLARDIGIDPRNITRTIKKLKACKIIIEKDGNSYINPQVIIKGRFRKKDEESNELIELGSKLGEEVGIDTNIYTKKMRLTEKIKTKDKVGIDFDKNNDE